jgi:hypothetical protein
LCYQAERALADAGDEFAKRAESLGP